MAHDDQLMALVAGQERTDRRVKALTSKYDAVAHALAELLRREPQPKEPFVPTFVQHPDAAVVDLLDWVERVYLVYDRAWLAPCWCWHPGVVEELAWLRGAHQAVYASRDWLRIGDWHDRYRTGAVRRVREALSGCDIDNHRPVPPAPTVPLSEALTAIAAARNSNSPVPAPTDEQAHQARNLTTRSKATA